MVVINRLFYDAAQQKVCKLNTQILNALHVDFKGLYGENEQPNYPELQQFEPIYARAALKYCGGDIEKAKKLLSEGKLMVDQ